jgi:hypothetical protein
MALSPWETGDLQMIEMLLTQNPDLAHARVLARFLPLSVF